MADIKASLSRTRQRVINAREQVGKLRELGDLTSAERNIVDTTYRQLIDVEDLLVLKELQANIQKLKQASGDLGGLTGKMKKSVGRLKKIARCVDVAAKALGRLADAVSKVAKIL